jgi:hypothetical protein
MNARRWLLGWVLVALVAAQALGFMHRVAHAPQAGWGSAGAQAHAPAAPDHDIATHDRDGWLAALFAAHISDSSCRLYDAVGHDSLPLPAPPAALPVLAAGDILRCVAAAFIQSWTAPFHARGPPVSR